MFLKNIIRFLMTSLVSHSYNKYYHKILKKNNIKNIKICGEEKWIEKWSVLGKANPIYYRLFSHYIGNTPDIIPEDICRNIIEPILSPLQYVPYYSDKNVFDKLLGYNVMPQTIFRKINGLYYDRNYQYLDISNDKILFSLLNSKNFSKIVIKPSVDSCSGNGVRIFEKIENKWCEKTSNQELDLNYLYNFYGEDIIVQEYEEQVDFMSYYNPSSVNTLRLTLYRSVVTDECHIPSAILRIGKNGSLVDNAHAGGGYVGINVENGILSSKVFNQYGESLKLFNGIDFSLFHQIPNWDKVVDFAKSIGKNIPHHRLLALDIMINKSGEPKLIEFNCEAYSMWLFQFTVGPALGKFTNEVIEYCKNNLGKAQKIIKA